MDWITLLAGQLQPETVFQTLGYVPTERQSVFHAATERDVLYGGAAGGGKTKALLMQGIKWCHQNPGVRILAFRRTFPELRDSLIAELAQIEFARVLGAVWKATDRELVFPNRAVIAFRYAENVNDATKQQGAEYQGELFDELTLNPPDVVTFLQSRLRSGRGDIPVLGIRAASNPGGTGHGAVKGKYIDATEYGTLITPDGIRFIPSKVSDNPHIDAGYQARLDNLPEAMRKAFRDGSWDAFAGQYFTEWSHERHVVPRFDIPAEWLRYAGIDWGYAAPWAVEWAAIDEDGRAWVYDELYSTQVGEADQAQRILAAEEKHGHRAGVRYGDDAMWAGRGSAKSVARVYAEQGCHLREARKGERLSGWQRVRTYLADGPACVQHRDLGWDTCPMLHVLDGAAPNLVRTLPTLPYDTTAGRFEDVDTKAEDHAADALRYLLINLGRPSIEGFDLGPVADPDQPIDMGAIDPYATNPMDPTGEWADALWNTTSDTY